MKLDVLVNGIYRENCYIISSNNEAIVIDPGVDSGLIIDFLKANNLALKMILITHAHFDHCQCVASLILKTGATAYISKPDYMLMQSTEKIPPFFAKTYKNESLEFMNRPIKIINTPGHTAGSVCIELNQMLFSGDTLFKSAIGRTDLPTGNFDQLKESLKMLFKMYDDIVVYAGHGEPTLLSKERDFVEHL